MAGKKYRCSAEAVAEIQNAVARGANPNSATESGFTILHFLAKSGNEAAVRGLTARGVKFSESRDGTTPLDCAIDASDANMAKIFLELANVVQVQKSLLKAIGDKQEAVVKAIISDERFISEFSAMEKKSRNIAIEVLRGAANASLNKKLKAQISEFAKVVEEKVSVSHAMDEGAGAAPKAPERTRRELQRARAEERDRLAADAEAKKKYEEERRRINAERRAAELAAMSAEDFRLVEREQNEAEKRRVDAEKLAKKAAELLLPQAPAIGGGGGGSGGNDAPFVFNPAAPEFVPAYPAVVTVSPAVELPDWLKAIIHKITDLETCESFRLRGSKLYLQCIERSGRERSAHDFDFEILIPGTADLFLKDPEAEKKTREFVKENFGVEGAAVSIFFDRATNKFLSISIKHPDGVDFVIYDQPPKLDWSIDLDALRLEYKGNPDEPVLKFTSGFEAREDPPIPYPKKTSVEYEPIINFDSYKLLQRLCFFKVIRVIDRELISLIPPEKNCADMAFSEGGRFPEMLRKRLNAFVDNHGFFTAEKFLFLTEFKQLITRDEPRTVSKEEFKAFPEKVEEMIQELSGPSVTPRPTTAVGTGESAKFKF
jgi:hypothetical protein